MKQLRLTSSREFPMPDTRRVQSPCAAGGEGSRSIRSRPTVPTRPHGRASAILQNTAKIPPVSGGLNPALFGGGARGRQRRWSALFWRDLLFQKSCVGARRRLRQCRRSGAVGGARPGCRLRIGTRSDRGGRLISSNTARAVSGVQWSGISSRTGFRPSRGLVVTSLGPFADGPAARRARWPP